MLTPLSNSMSGSCAGQHYKVSGWRGQGQFNPTSLRISASAIDSSLCQFLLPAVSSPDENFPAEPHTSFFVLADNDHRRRTTGYLNSGCHQTFPFSTVQPRYFGLSNNVDIVEHTFGKVIQRLRLLFSPSDGWKWNKIYRQTCKSAVKSWVKCEPVLFVGFPLILVLCCLYFVRP